MVYEIENGIIVHGNWPIDLGVKFPLIIADPSYGHIVNQPWDHMHEMAQGLADEQLNQLIACNSHLIPNGAIYWFGGVGIPGYRPFYMLASKIESTTDLTIAMHITWAKKRAYGVQHNYLFTREEILYLTNGDPKKPATFHVPYLAEKRGYTGYNPKYPAHDERKRRTCVWSDITEIMRGKLHECEKPQELLKVIIETHTNPGDWVLDLFSGSGSASLAAKTLGRKFVAIESDKASAEAIYRRLTNG